MREVGPRRKLLGVRFISSVVLVRQLHTIGHDRQIEIAALTHYRRPSDIGSAMDALVSPCIGLCNSLLNRLDAEKHISRELEAIRRQVAAIGEYLQRYLQRPPLSMTALGMLVLPIYGRLG